MDGGLSDGALLRELSRLNYVLKRHSREGEDGRTAADFLLGVLANKQDSIDEGLSHGSFTQAELADVVGMRPQTVGGLLAQLEAEGCIERIACEHDRRVRLVVLTDVGRSRAAAVLREWEHAATCVFSCLSEQEKQALGAVVVKLNTTLDAPEGR